MFNPLERITFDNALKVYGTCIRFNIHFQFAITDAVFALCKYFILFLFCQMNYIFRILFVFLIIFSYPFQTRCIIQSLSTADITNFDKLVALKLQKGLEMENQ